MSRTFRLTLIAVPIAVIVAVVGVLLVLRAARAGEIPNGVTVQGIDLSGLGEEDARAALLAREAELRAAPAVFLVNQREFALDPREVGLDVNEDAVLEQAFDVPGPGLFGGSEPVEIELPVVVNEAALDEVLEGWESIALPDPVFDGAVIIRGGRAIPDYPRRGQEIAKPEATGIVTEVLAQPARLPTELPLADVEPRLTRADIEAAVEEANLVITRPILLASTDPEIEIEFTPADLSAALRSEVVESSPASLQLWLDSAALAPLVEPFRETVELPPRDAAFEVDEETDEVTILPSRPATLLDVDLVALQLYEMALAGDVTGEFPFAPGTPPQFTTEDAEGMEPLGLVSKFTTSYPAGQDRVINIHQMAKTVNGATVLPGDEFSLNEYVGQRTTAKGYVPAPMILRGELVDDVGGGVSQFATTFYNAVFYGCYEDVDHKPHSYYFSRYPEVNEATISWPTPDLVFRNDSEAVILIRTDITSTSLTVKFYGNNGGRTCERRLGNRYAFTDPPVEYEADPSVNPGQEIVKQSGFGGFSNSVVREMTMSDGSVIEQSWTWTYSAQPRILRVHPCEVPNATTACPIQIPSVIGLTYENAAAALQEAGFAVVRGEDVAVETEGENGLVKTQSPGGGTFAQEGATVTLSVGVYTPPDDEPPPEEDPPPEE